MERLNYHHLLYFYAVAHEGSVVRASLRLGLKQPTVSAQIHALETRLGRKLLERSGRGLRVTAAGETVLRYAEGIFALGDELLAALDGQAEDAPKLTVGVSSSLAPALVTHLLEAVLKVNPRPVLTVVEGTAERLAAQLAMRSPGFVLTDAPLENPVAGLHVRVLAEGSVEVFAAAALFRKVLAREAQAGEKQAGKVRKDFEAWLADAPVLMPGDGALGREVESWLGARKITVRKLARMAHPEMVAASAGAAIFAGSLLRGLLKKTHGLLPVGELQGSRWRLFAVTAGKGFRHPALDAVMLASKALR
jgi:LysR family transcriptional activator of nhaA